MKQNDDSTFPLPIAKRFLSFSTLLFVLKDVAAAEAQKSSKILDNRSVTATTNSSSNSLFLAFEPETNSAVNQSFSANKTEEQNGEGIVPNGKPKTGKWTTAFIQLVMVVLVVGTLLLCGGQPTEEEKKEEEEEGAVTGGDPRDGSGRTPQRPDRTKSVTPMKQL
ncbi:hypothetical protein niasHS_014634 [Heterodera schachtii]|uniref:Uncharacterized protein n=1 Tax=Heterodera schachtii TaxID=97005 RepID=A0ABD2IIB2_HETSC